MGSYSYMPAVRVTAERRGFAVGEVPDAGAGFPIPKAPQSLPAAGICLGSGGYLLLCDFDCQLAAVTGPASS